MTTHKRLPSVQNIAHLPNRMLCRRSYRNNLTLGVKWITIGAADKSASHIDKFLLRPTHLLVPTKARFSYTECPINFFTYWDVTLPMAYFLDQLSQLQSKRFLMTSNKLQKHFLIFILYKWTNSTLFTLLYFRNIFGSNKTG